MIAAESHKAKTARRVIEVFEFFDKQNRCATVMDIARRFNRPQSSTSELLAIMVEMGLLYKDRVSRTFRPTPRAAMLGSAFQPSVVRDGRLSMLIDCLSTETGLGVAVVGMVGLNAQIFCWTPRNGSPAVEPHAISGGASVGLNESAVGWLLCPRRAATAATPCSGVFAPKWLRSARSTSPTSGRRFVNAASGVPPQDRPGSRRDLRHAPSCCRWRSEKVLWRSAWSTHRLKSTRRRH